MLFNCASLRPPLSPKIGDGPARKKLSTTIGASNYAYPHNLVKAARVESLRSSSGQGSGIDPLAGQPRYVGASDCRLFQRPELAAQLWGLTFFRPAFPASGRFDLKLESLISFQGPLTNSSFI
jgi:hypothetical protein